MFVSPTVKVGEMRPTAGRAQRGRFGGLEFGDEATPRRRGSGHRQPRPLRSGLERGGPILSQRFGTEVEPDGSFVLEGLPKGEAYDLVITDDEGLVGTAGGVRTGDTVTVDLVLSEPIAAAVGLTPGRLAASRATR